MELLKVENLTFTYPKQESGCRLSAEPTLQNVSFQVQEGAFVVVCGESGCGKTTLAETAEARACPGRRTFWEHLVSRRAATGSVDGTGSCL